ncbi:MAG: 1,2-phenylacetyl-CoA epoxidase subunit PaaD [Bacteroidota bacterium]
MTATIFNQQEIYKSLEEVMDPEIPTLSVIDMGMITGVEETVTGVCVKMIPTFMACPAIHVIKDSIQKKVESLGYENVEVLVDDSIVWDSDRITPNGKILLENFGLGTPQRHCGNFGMEEIAHSKCPHCGGDDTTMNSIFGSTLCRSTHFCFSCKQAFERFKPV